jgi:hypothetical protein
MVPRLATFTSDLPCPSPEEVSVDKPHPESRVTIDLLKDWLTARGLSIPGVYEHSYYGWTFYARGASIPLHRVLVQGGGDVEITVSAFRSGLRSLLPGARPAPELLQLVFDALTTNATFRELRAFKQFVDTEHPERGVTAFDPTRAFFTLKLVTPVEEPYPSEALELGQNLASGLAAALRKRGLKSRCPRNRYEAKWEVYLDDFKPQQSYLLELRGAPEGLWLLEVSDLSWKGPGGKVPPELHALVSEAIADDPRWKDVRWFERLEEIPGAELAED